VVAGNQRIVKISKAAMAKKINGENEMVAAKWRGGGAES
jgi:hypothetical protein